MKEGIRALLKLDLSFKQQSHCLLGLLEAPSEVSGQDADVARKDGISPVFQPMLPATPATSCSGYSSERGGFAENPCISESPDLLHSLGFLFCCLALKWFWLLEFGLRFWPLECLCFSSRIIQELQKASQNHGI